MANWPKDTQLRDLATMARGLPLPANSDPIDSTPLAEHRYPTETLNEDYEDDGTMPENVKQFSESVIGHHIVSAEQGGNTTVITLDDGRHVTLADTDDCCAYTNMESFWLHPESVDHMILGVGTTDGYTTWHVYADYGDIMKLQVGWSCGNPFYYGYGFSIKVKD